MSIATKSKRRKRTVHRLKPNMAMSSSNGKQRQGRARKSLTPTISLPSLVSELRALQRERAWVIKSRVMIGNRLTAMVAGTLGYHSGMKEAERKKVWLEAGKLIKRIAKGETDSPIAGLVLVTQQATGAFDAKQTALEKAMLELVTQLPVAEWVQQPAQRGFGLLNLAIVIGEAGDLAEYPNPGKLWKRFGCAPFEKQGEMLMGSTWRRRSKTPGVTRLSAEDWEAFGYSPRRRSIAYNIAKPLMNGNYTAGDGTSETDYQIAGPYRQRYDDAKTEAARNHPDWTPLHCHLHGLLLTAKLLLRELWAEWNGRPTAGKWIE